RPATRGELRDDRAERDRLSVERLSALPAHPKPCRITLAKSERAPLRYADDHAMGRADELDDRLTHAGGLARALLERDDSPLARRAEQEAGASLLEELDPSLHDEEVGVELRGHGRGGVVDLAPAARRSVELPREHVHRARLFDREGSELGASKGHRRESA